jgi:chromosomal replication initiation ATPase DnaA
MSRSAEDVETIRKRLIDRGLYALVMKVCLAYNVAVDDVLRGRRRIRVVRGRDASIVRLLGKGLSLSEVGELLGMDHSSIRAAQMRYMRRDRGRALT